MFDHSVQMLCIELLASLHTVDYKHQVIYLPNLTFQGETESSLLVILPGHSYLGIFSNDQDETNQPGNTYSHPHYSESAVKILSSDPETCFLRPIPRKEALR